MTLKEQFDSFVQDNNLDRETIITESYDEYEVVSFSEQINSGNAYNVILVIYNDNDSVEVYIRKISKTPKATMEILSRLNELNSEYKGMTFFMEDDWLVLKALVSTGGDINQALKTMLVNIQIADFEFKEM